jgi:Ca2+-binding RTX toxin-like protein
MPTTFETRIFLETKQVSVSGAGHLYLVKRTVEVDENGVIVNNAYQPLIDQVIRGGPSGFDLQIVTGLLHQSGDAYGSGTTPVDRQSQDISSLLEAANPGQSLSQIWSSMELFASDINGQYKYDPPNPTTSPTANSNATIFSVLNQAGIDVRSINVASGPYANTKYVDAFYFAGHPGADSDNPTLLATSDSDIISGLNLQSGAIILGRDGEDDTLVGSAHADRLYGEQRETADYTDDTVNYVNSNAGVVIATGSQGGLAGTGGHAQGDELYGIENIIGSEHADQISMWEDGSNPTIRGRTKNKLEGLGGNDILKGGAGDDELLGGSGGDHLYGGANSDKVDGNAGVDFLDGGSGTDAAHFSDVTGNVHIKKLTPSDVPAGVEQNSSPIYQVSFLRANATETDKIRDFETIAFGDAEQRLLLEGDLSIGETKMRIDGGGGIDGVDFSRLEQGLTTQVQTIDGLEYVVANGTGAALRNVEGWVGTKHADTIATNEGVQLLYGREGADTLSAGVGEDVLEGGLGDDIVTGGAGNDKFIIGQGFDTIMDSEAGDRLFIRLPVANGTDPETSADAADVVPVLGGFFLFDYWESPYTQTLSQHGAFFHPRSYSTNDTEVHSALHTSLGTGYSLLFGLTGNDLEIYISYTGVDWTYGKPHVVNPDARILIKDYEDGDFGLTFANLVLPFDLETGFHEDLNNTYKTSHSSLVNGGSFGTQTVAKNFLVEQTGTGGNDNMNGTDGDDRMSGGGGADTLNAFAGADEIFAGSGNDVVDAGEGDDKVRAGEGDDEVEGGGGDDEILGEGGEDTIEAGAGDDAIEGGDDDDVIFAEDGNDVVAGGEGNDWIVGGDGDDTIVFGNAEGGDTLADFSVADDVISIWVSNVWDFSTLLNYAYEDAGDTYIDFWEQGTSMRLVGVTLASLDEENFTFAFVGTSGDDYIEGTLDADNIVGLAGHDILVGSDGNDVITGGEGNDELSGGSGDDRLVAGAGSDAIDGSDGADTYVFGLGDGEDTIIDWGPETDIIEFGAGVLASNITVERGLNDFWDARLVLNTGESLTITGQFSDPNFMMEEFKFADGTTWSEEDVRLIYLEQQSTEDGDDIHGFYVSDVIDGKDGNDFINADAGVDTITGGWGDDVLTGGSEEDTFVFNADFGLDTITDLEYSAGAGDVIHFGDGLFADFAAVMNAATQVGSNVEIVFDEFNVVTLENVTKANLNQDDFLLT